MNSKDLASSVGSTSFFVEQITNKLKRAGIVTSRKGPGGGHMANEGSVNGYQILSALNKVPEMPEDEISKSIVSGIIKTYENLVIS